jgi:cobalt-zinc-cadmium efflux system outer membrane protein
VPDPDVSLAIERDFTSPPLGPVFNVQIGIPVPVFDRNQGGILEAQANLARARHEVQRVRSELGTRLAGAFERYMNSRYLLEAYRKQTLPSQIQAYRGAVQRHNFTSKEQPGPEFFDVMTAEQNLVQVVAGYLTTLHELWQAVVDISALMQNTELHDCAEQFEVPPIPQVAAHERLPAGAGTANPSRPVPTTASRPASEPPMVTVYPVDSAALPALRPAR